MKSTSLLQESKRKEFRYVQLYFYHRVHLEIDESTFVQSFIFSYVKLETCYTIDCLIETTEDFTQYSTNTASQHVFQWLV